MAAGSMTWTEVAVRLAAARDDRRYLPDHDPDFDVVWAIRPRSAMAWRLDDYAASQRRWTALS